MEPFSTIQQQALEKAIEKYLNDHPELVLKRLYLNGEKTVYLKVNATSHTLEFHMPSGWKWRVVPE